MSETIEQTPGTLPKKKPKQRRSTPREIVIAQREVEALYRVSRGVKYSEIAAELEISENTVKGTLKRVYRKLGAKSGAHAVSLAIGHGMFTAEPPNLTIPIVMPAGTGVSS